MAKEQRIIVTMECKDCGARNYTTTKNKKNNPERLVLNKYCGYCKKHTEHKETK